MVGDDVSEWETMVNWRSEEEKEDSDDGWKDDKFECDTSFKEMEDKEDFARDRLNWEEKTVNFL